MATVPIRSIRPGLPAFRRYCRREPPALLELADLFPKMTRLIGYGAGGGLEQHELGQSLGRVAAIRFCEVMFGPDYASLMSKAAEMARPVERKAAEPAKPAKQPRAG